MSKSRPSRGLTVGEVARRAGIAPSAVRYYESIELLPPAERVGGWRRFPDSVLETLSLIQAAQSAGFSLGEVKVLLRAADEGDGTGTLRQLAAAKLPELEASIARLLLMRDILTQAAACACPTLAQCSAMASQAVGGTEGRAT